MKTDETRVKELLKEHLENIEIVEITRMGGLTNRTYKVRTLDNTYVVRLPGEGTEEIIVRSDEKKSTELACSLGIDAKLYFFDGTNGEKIMDYIEDSVTMDAERLRRDENVQKCAEVFSLLHNSDVDTQVPFDVIEMSNTYEDFIRRHGGTFYEDFQDVKRYINEIKDSYMIDVKKVPCHNDALCENWVRQGEKMYLIDWEYAGMNDPMWDLADVSIEADFTEENDNYFLECYFGREATEKEKRAFLINKVLIDYLWSLWGKTRAVYDGEELEEYARVRYNRMKETIKKMEE